MNLQSIAARPAGAAKPAASPLPGAAAFPPAGDARILVVDDNEDIIALTRRILEKQSYQVLVCHDGKSALEMARREKPDLILLDVMLPEMDGLEVCRQLKKAEETRKLMVLLVTGRGSIDHRVEGLDAGADDYITKPFHLTELIARVRSALRIKRLTDELEDRNRQLIESERDRIRSEKMATIGLLASGIAHEFNNIMSGISGYAQLARKNPQFMDQLVEVTLTQSERALQITRSLSTFNRAAALMEPVDVARTLENAICLVKKEADDHHVEIIRQFDSAPVILGQAGQLQQVFLNLLINAIQAIRDDGKISIRIQGSGEKVQIDICDSGCGVPPGIIDRIFDPFFTTKGALGGGMDTGSGLGLTVSYNIIKSHGGNLSVCNNPDRGATFTVALPAADARLAAAAAAEGKESRLDLPVHILIADTDQTIGEMAAQCLSAGSATGCFSWKELFQVLQEETIDLVILATDLPDGSSSPTEASFRENFNRLCREFEGLPVILTSSHISPEAMKLASGQACPHLLKPYSMENLASLLVRTCEAHGKRQAAAR